MRFLFSSKTKLTLLVIVFLTSASCVILGENTVFAARGIFNVCRSDGNPNDVTYFPYRFICGSSNEPSWFSVRISPTERGGSSANPTTVRSANNLQLGFSGGYTTAGSEGTNTPLWKNNNNNLVPPADGELMVWVTIDGNDNLLGSPITTAQDSTGRIGITNNPVPQTPGKIIQCPGEGSGMYSIVFNHRDEQPDASDPDYGRPGPNQSPAAYNKDRPAMGKEDCGTQGKAVYWRNATMSTNYGFRINVPNGEEGKICVRYNLSMRFRDTDELFHSNSAYNNPANDQSSVASHLVQQSREECYMVEKPPSPDVNNSCQFYSSTNSLVDHSWYRFTYFNIDADYKAAGTYTNSSVSMNTFSPPGWASFVPGAPIKHQTRAGFAGNSDQTALNVGYTNWTDPPAIYNDSASTKAFYYNFGNPDGPDRNLYIERWTHIALDDDNRDGVVNSADLENDWQYAGGYNPQRDCYTASCTVSTNNTGLGSDQNGVTTGQRFTASFTITNTGRDILYSLIGSNNLGVYGSGGPWTGLLKEVGTYISVGRSVTVSTELTAPSSPGTYPINAYLMYPGINFTLYGGPRPGGGSYWGSPCNQVNINVYQPFQLTPSGSASYDDDEQPTAFNFRTYVRNDTDVAVNIDGSYSCVYESPSTNCPPSISQVNTPDSVAANARAYFYGSGSADASIPVSQPYKAGDKHCAKLYLPYTYGFVGPGGSITEPGGEFSQNWCDTVTNKPFFKVDNASVSVGADYASEGCTGDGVLAGWFKRDVVATNYFYNRGASVDYSVMGKSTVSGVGSRQLTRFNSPTELTFANTVPGDIDTPGNSSEPDLGGNFGDARCIDDVTPPPDPTNVEYRTGNVNLSSVYFSMSDPNAIVVNQGENKALYVDGNIFIDKNINMVGPFTPGKGSSIVLKANKGNIYIAPNVTNIDGILVATPDGNTKGEIYTCANGFAKMPNDQVYNSCATQLVFHGNVVARKVNMERTYGSLRDEKFTNAGNNGGTTGGTPGITQKMVWVNNSDSKPTGYKKCVQVQEDEDEDDDVWNNNWLCLSTADEDRNIDLVYSHENKPSGVGCPLLSIGEAIRAARTAGIIGEDEEGSWNNNWLCTNEFNTGVLVAVSPFDPTISTRLCTVLGEPDDDHADGVWSNTSGSSSRMWACMNRYVAGTPTPGTSPTAPNPLRCSVPAGTALSTRGTCAAEIYEFSPELYMSQPRTGGSVDKKIKWDSITSLPPVL